MSNISYSNKLICETYKADRDLRKVVSNGFATVEQKSKIVGLTVLIDAKLLNGDIIRAGSKVFVKEATLRTSPALKESYECETMDQRFVVVDLALVEFISPPSGDAA